jgi:hypothetical protein
MTRTQFTNDGAGNCSAPSLEFATDDENDFVPTLPSEFAAQFAGLVERRAGVIEVDRGRPFAAHARFWSRRPSQLEALYWGARVHRRRPGDHCWLYYHQPRRFPNFLVVSYVLSARQTSLATIRVTLGLLDLLAKRKRTDALLCDVATARISDRALARWGWEPLAPSRWHRRRVKRFYGHYDVDEDLLAPPYEKPTGSSGQLTLSR